MSAVGAESYRESDGYRPGDRAVLADTPFGTLGMSICYDMRFPHLYRALAQAGAEILTVPSAFSVPPARRIGRCCLRARAIETGAYVLAPAQTGTHAASRGKRRRDLWAFAGRRAPGGTFWPMPEPRRA